MAKIPVEINKQLPQGEKKHRICALCGKKIEDTAFVMVRGAIIIDDYALKNPTVFTCMEQAFNYAQGYFAHSICWIDQLKKLGIPLYNMDAVYKEYNKKLKINIPSKKKLSNRNTRR